MQVQKSAQVKGLPQLPARRSAGVAVKAQSAVPAETEGKFLGVGAFTWQKIVPLGLMFFW